MLKDLLFIIGTFIVVEILMFAFWFGISALLILFASIIGLFEFNLSIILIFTIILKILSTILYIVEDKD